MSRRRYISTNISLDPQVNKLAMQYGDFAALLYTWMIPHAEDTARITGDPEELLLLVVPGRRDKTVEDVSRAIEGMIELGLLYEVKLANGKTLLQFPPESFYKYQTYIPPSKRTSNIPGNDGDNPDDQRKTPKNAEENNSSLESAQNAVIPSPSPSPSPSPREKESTTDSTTYEDVPPPPEKELPAPPPVHIPGLKEILNEAVRAYYEKWPDERKKYKVAGVVTARKVFEQGLTGADGDDPIDPDRLMQQIVNWPDIIPPTPWDIVKACRAGPWEQSWADINASINEFLAKERERHASSRDAP